MSAMADFLTDVDAVISADPIRRETCNLAGVGFRWIVEIWPDPESQLDIHPSLYVTKDFMPALTYHTPSTKFTYLVTSQMFV